MLCAIEIKNPYQVSKELPGFLAEDGLTLRQLFARMYPDFVKFEFPTLVMVDSQPWMQEEWDIPLPKNARVAIVTLPGSWEWVVVYLVIAIVSIVLALVLTPSATATNQDQTNGESVYTLSGQRNQIKLNDPIESLYGRNRHYPPYAARPYNVYEGNQQFQFSLYCLGQGFLDIEDMFYEETPIENFEEVDFEIIPPGQEVTLFADNVDTSSAVSNVELFGPNESEFSGWSGGFIVNDVYTKTNRIEIDVALPAGLYALDDQGDMNPMSVQAAFQYREITDSGAPLSDWQPLVFSKKRVVKYNRSIYGSGGRAGIKRTPVYETIDVPVFYKRLATATPQRFTLGKDVPLGRYEVRGQRTSNKNKSQKVANTLRWEALRAFFPSVRTYGNVTLVAVKARASNSLNNNASQKFNVICTRMLPTWSANGGWTEPVRTRNPVWAFCDIFMSAYGGRLPAEHLDLEELAEKADAFELSRTYFDHIYDSQMTMWEAAKLVARVARGIPILNSSQITMVQEGPKVTHTATFNLNNIIKGSFKWNCKFLNIEETDGVEILYVDEQTWKEETVLCLIDDDEGANPETIRLPGVTDRRRAYLEGLFIRAQKLMVRENIEFDTTRMGYIPRYGDMILVSHDVPNWGQAGIVTDITGAFITLSHAVTFEEGEEHVMILRVKDGTGFGPYPVIPTEDPFVVEMSIAPNLSDFFFDTVHEPPYFFFGKPNEEAKRCVVVGIDPRSEEVITIKAAAYVPEVFSFTDLPTPPRGSFSPSVREPDRPTVSTIDVMALPGTSEFIMVSWPPALGAKSYLLEESSDGETWVRAVTLPSTVAQIRVIPSDLHLRVAGVNVDIGPWAYWSGRVGDIGAIPEDVENLTVYSRGNGSVTFRWDSLLEVDGYEFTVYEQASTRLLRRFYVTTTEASYTWAEAQADGLVGTDIIVRVRGKNILGLSENSAELTTFITEPIASSGGSGFSGLPTCDNDQGTVDTSILTCDII